MNKNVLEDMLKDLDQHHRQKAELLPHYINRRLAKSLKNYYRDLLEAYSNLTKKDTVRVLKRMFPGEVKK